MAAPLRRTLRAERVEHDDATNTFRFVGNDFGSAWAFTLGPGAGGASLADHTGRSVEHSITNWLISGRYVRFRLSQGAQAALGLQEDLRFDFRDVDTAVSSIENDLRTLLGPSDADLVHLVVEDIFRLKARPAPVVVCRREAGQVVVGQRVAVAWPDGRHELGRVVGLEAHSRPGTVALMVATDSGSELATGAVVTSDRRG